jgi:hypothetical protein
MTTLFVVCFIAGLGLSVVSFVSGLQHVTVFDNIFHGHRMLHMPRAVRHAGARKGKASSMINAAAITAFLTWFGGGGLLLERLTPWIVPAVIGGAVAESLSMIGVIARTVMPIREKDGTGEIVFTHAGTRRVAGARSESGRAIPKGTEVIVTRYEKGIAYVSLWDELKEEEPSC